APRRAEPGAEVLDRVKERLNKEINQFLAAKNPLNQMQLQLLARAYHVKWTPAYQNPAVVQTAVRGLDALAITYRTNKEIAHAGPATYNPEWFGLGPCGDVLHLLREPIQPLLNVKIDAADQASPDRKTAYADMLVESRDWHTRHRRLYTNQSMINDLYIFAAHRGVAAVDPSRAKSDQEMLRYLHESIGLEPWLGSETDNGPEKPVGDKYYQLTKKGLSRELGYVGYYGEVLDWVAQIYDVTRPAVGKPGDSRIAAQLAKIALARAVFRYPTLDADGNRAMRIEAIVGWRDAHYPGNVVYAQRSSWDASAAQVAADTLEPKLVAFVHQMFDDNQFFKSVDDQLRGGGLRITAGLLGVPDQYESIKAQPKTNVRLPMTPGQPDFVFSDEEDGVVAVKNGDDILYVSLYWRARNAVNFLARVHYMTPTMDRIAVVRQETQLQPSGQTYTRPDHINFGFANGGLKYPGEVHSAHAGEKLPIAKVPADVKFAPGRENVYAGKGDFYTCSYGPYVIAMNCSKDKDFQFRAPDTKNVVNLATREPVSSGASLKVPAGTTIVLYTRTAATKN
ncbi:MAG: hypothetical protein H7144_09975, partial [Burkholderiales bacterium]|nr:hypothetical protein [Phycisphaerae bacterium]